MLSYFSLLPLVIVSSPCQFSTHSDTAEIPAQVETAYRIAVKRTSVLFGHRFGAWLVREAGRAGIWRRAR